MSLERKDARFKLDDQWHAMLRATADAEDKTDAEWVEALVLRELRKRVHAATVLAAAAHRLGLSGNFGESPGGAGK